MARGAVSDWGAVFKKGVRSKDDVQVGTVVGTSQESVLIERGSKLMYDVPKAAVEGFDGNEIFLKLSSNELARYERRV
jgi:hypothetical protein